MTDHHEIAKYNEIDENIQAYIKTEVTRHLEEEQKLETLIKSWRTAFDAITQAVVLVDNQEMVIRCNMVMAHFFGKTFREIIGTNLFELLNETADYLCEEPFHNMYVDVLKDHFEFRKDDRWFDMIWDPFVDTQGNRIGRIYIFSDITERKLYEEKIINDQKHLRSITKQLFVTEQRERQQIAVTLHETLGQSLAFAKLKLDSIKDTVTSPEIRAVIDSVLELTIESIRQTRSISFDFSPPLLNELGFGAAIEWLAGSLERQYNLVVDFEGDYNIKLSSEITSFLYRAIHELLLNVLKHANTNHASVMIEYDDDMIKLALRDEGKGFDPNNILSSTTDIGHFGLINLRERLYALGGSMTIISSPGKGACICLELPCEIEYATERE
ncbi:MAG: PAS domain-containing sensor histidine kinase [Armatimonadota bacterium]